MRIAIATDDGAEVSGHTGRCQGFVIFDVNVGQAQRVEDRANTFTGHAQGLCTHEHDGEPGSAPGVGHHSHAALLENLGDCEALVTRGLGRRLIQDLASRGITAYVCAPMTADEAAQQFAAGKLVVAQGCGSCAH